VVQTGEEGGRTVAGEVSSTLGGARLSCVALAQHGGMIPAMVVRDTASACRCRRQGVLASGDETPGRATRRPGGLSARRSSAAIHCPPPQFDTLVPKERVVRDGIK